MAVTLEWVKLPEGVRFRTVCRNGVPWFEPTGFLTQYGHIGLGSSRTVDTYAERLLPFCQWVSREQLSFAGIHPGVLRRFRRDLVVYDASQPPLLKKGADSSDRTIRDTVAMALRFMAWYGEQYQTDSAPGMTSKIRSSSGLRFAEWNSWNEGRPRVKRKLPKTLTSAQLDVCRKWIMAAYTFDPVLQIRNRAIFELLLGGALRLGALLGLKTKNIFWTDRRMLISYQESDYRTAWHSKQRHFRTAKTGEYMVTLDAETLLWLNRYFLESRPAEAVRRNHGVFFCEHRPGCDDHGAPIHIATVRYLFQSLARSVSDGGSGIHVTPHMLRHTWATMALESGLPREVVQYQLGHQSSQSTDQYSHVSPQWVREALEEWHRTRSQGGRS